MIARRLSGTGVLCEVDVNGILKPLGSGSIQGSTNFATDEAPCGRGAGATALTVAHTPVSTVCLYRNGVRQPSSKFSLAGTTITLVDAMLAADSIVVDYRL